MKGLSRLAFDTKSITRFLEKNIFQSTGKKSVNQDIWDIWVQDLTVSLGRYVNCFIVGT